MGKLFQELKRRNVFKVGAVYVVVAWLLIQIVTAVIPTFNAPDWVSQTIIFLLALGLPITLIIVWAFELTPQGIRKTQVTDTDESVTTGIGDYALGALLLIVLGFMTVQQFDLFDAEDGGEPSTNVVEVAESSVLVEEPVGSINEPATTIDSMSLAVLILTNESPDPDNAYFAAGVHQEIVNQLAKISAIQVKSRTTVLSYVGSGLGTVEIARELNVGMVMEGSVYFAGNTVRITLQLIDAINDVQMESFNSTFELEDIFANQADVAIQVAEAMQATLLPNELARIERPPTNSTEAYNLLLQHRYQTEQEGGVAAGTEDDFISLGIPRLKRAIDLDPQFAVAIANLATLTFFRSNGASNPTEREELGDEAIRLAKRAIEIDTTIAQAYIALANIARQRHQWNEMESYYLQALDLPDLDGRTAVNYALTLRALGRIEESYAWYDMAISRSPNYLNWRHFAVETRFIGRDYTTALELLEGYRAAGGNENDYHVLRAYALNRLDRQAESLNELRLVPEGPTFRNMTVHHFHDYLRCQLGERDDSVMEELEKLKNDLINRRIIYCAAGAGEVDEMFEVILRWLRSSAPASGFVIPVLNLEEVRSDPRSQGIEAYLNLPDWNSNN